MARKRTSANKNDDESSSLLMNEDGSRRQILTPEVVNQLTQLAIFVQKGLYASGAKVLLKKHPELVDPDLLSELENLVSSLKKSKDAKNSKLFSVVYAVLDGCLHNGVDDFFDKLGIDPKITAEYRELSQVEAVKPPRTRWTMIFPILLAVALLIALITAAWLLIQRKLQ